MKKRTVISSHIDWNNHTAYVKNQGIEELSLFKTLKDNGFELKDDEMTDNELCALLRHLCIDGIIEAVVSIENHFNRDQVTINAIKKNIEYKLKTQGLQIITHCDWQPSFSDGGDTINLRNYLTILNENIKEKKLKIDNLDYEINNKIKELNKLKKDKLQELEDDISVKKDILERELGELDIEIEQNRQKIKQQNWYIDKTKQIEDIYNQKLHEFNKLVERYRNGEKSIEEQKNKLPDDIKQLLSQKKELEAEIDKLNNDKHEIEIKNRNITNELNAIEDNIRKSTSIYNNINDKTIDKMDYILRGLVSNSISFDEAKDKFLMTVKMYIQNNMKVPEFEKEYANKIGLDVETIKNIIDSVIPAI